MDNYENKLDRERAWYLDQEKMRRGHVLNSRAFYSRERQAFNYSFARKEMARLIERVMASSGLADPSLLVAPVGAGSDLPFLAHLTEDITGIDLSQEALDSIKDDRVKLFQGDMRSMERFADGQFDVVLTPLFFHHFNGMHGVFLKELVRVLKPGGHFISLEPSSLHPVTWITRSVRRVVGNITGLVEDEAPFRPSRLTHAMVDCGLLDVKVRGASFSHNRLPVWVARVNNIATRPLLTMPLAKHFAWLCLFYGRKPRSATPDVRAGGGETVPTGVSA